MSAPEMIDVTTSPFGLSVLKKHRGRSYNKVSVTVEHVIVESPFYATHTYVYTPPDIWVAAVATANDDPMAALQWPSRYTLTEVTGNVVTS